MSITYKINGRKVSQRELRAWEKRRAEVFGVVPPWEVPGSAPAIRTADTFFRGKKQGVTNEDFDERTLAAYRQRAAQAGTSTHNKFYFGQLADDAGDPQAWCADESDVIAVAKRKKMQVTIGGKHYDFREHYRDPVHDPKDYMVAQDIVDGHVDRMIEQGASPSQREELEERVRKDITPER